MTDRVLAGIVMMVGGKILLVLDRKETAGRWSIPKGRVEETLDQSLFTAAVRELREEAGVDLSELNENDCFAVGALSYTRKGREIVLHFFAIERMHILLDSSATAGEPMSGIGLFAPALAMKLIRPEQRPLVEAIVLGGGVPAATGAALAMILDRRPTTESD